MEQGMKKAIDVFFFLKSLLLASYFLLPIFSTLLYARGLDTLWTKTYGGAVDDWGYSTLQTADNGYIIVGATKSFGAGENDVFLIKTDSLGDILWAKTYGGANNDCGYSVQETSDGGFIVAGVTASFGAGADDIYLIKTNADGDTLWTKTYGGTDNDVGHSVQLISDEGYIIAGGTSSFGAGADDVWLLKTDSNGDTLWTKTFGGTNSDCGHSVQQTLDDGFIVAGVTASSGAGEGDFWLLKTDPLGDTVWTRTYGRIRNDEAHYVQQTSDEGYIVAGTGYWTMLGYEMVIIKTDKYGDSLWQHCNGSLNDDCAYSVVEIDSNSGYIVAGNFSYEIFIVGVDTNGISHWSQMFGGFGDDCSYSIQKTSDGGYIIAGITNSYGAGQYDVYLIKTAPDTFSVKEYQNSNPPRFSLEVSPDPFRIQTKIRYTIQDAGYRMRNTSLKIYDAAGSLVKDFSRFTPSALRSTLIITWHGDDNFGRKLPSGIYFVRLSTDDYSTIKKVILIR